MSAAFAIAAYENEHYDKPENIEQSAYHKDLFPADGADESKGESRPDSAAHNGFVDELLVTEGLCSAGF